MSYNVSAEMVRQAFVAQYGYSPELFDNWLRAIVEEERKRIIALIFDEENLALADLITGWYYGGENKDRSKAVALIKGEQK